MSSHETMSKRAKLHRCPFDMLNAEILAKALGYLAWKDALKSRACVKLKDAAKDAFACSDDDDAIRVNVEDDRSYQLLESIARSGSIDVKFLFVSNDDAAADRRAVKPIIPAGAVHIERQIEREVQLHVQCIPHAPQNQPAQGRKVQMEARRSAELPTAGRGRHLG